jgi:hypothetical protein
MHSFRKRIAPDYGAPGQNPMITAAIVTAVVLTFANRSCGYFPFLLLRKRAERSYQTGGLTDLKTVHRVAVS